MTQLRPRPVRSVLVALAVCAAATVTLAACTKKEEPPPGPALPTVPKLDLWDGVPALTPLPEDARTVLAPKAGPERPPQVGEEIDLPFPPVGPSDAAPEAPDPGALEVLRFGPEGKQSLVDAVRVSFNQPMVPLSSVALLRAKGVPFEIDPKPAGKARWLGTDTAAFFADGRMPFSTTYRVTVPAGVASTGGAALDEAVSWTFSTPTLALVSSIPADTATEVELRPTIVLNFNQSVKQTELVAALSLQAGRTAVELELAPPDEDKGHEAKAEPLEPWQEGRVVRLRPTEDLTANTRYTLKIPKGSFGEGPDASDPVTLSFRTYPPVRLRLEKCSGPCRPRHGIRILSSTQIAEPELTGKVHVEPEVAGFGVSSYGSTISLRGEFEGEATYTVRVDAGVRDTHRQELRKPFKARMKMGSLHPQLQLTRPGRPSVVIERGADAKLALSVAGLNTVQVRAAAYDLTRLSSLFNPEYRDQWEWPGRIGDPTFDTTLKVRTSRKKKERLAVDVADLVGPGKNLAFVVARSNTYNLYGWKERAGLSQLIQVTDLGLAAAVGPNRGVALVTSLSSGAPIEGVKLEVVDRYAGTSSWSGRTNAEGLAQIDRRFGDGNNWVITAAHGEDQAFVELNQSDLRGSWMGRAYPEPKNRPRAFIFTDRNPYKPGETVHLTGIVRLETYGPQGEVKSWGSGLDATYTVTEPRGIELTKGELTVGPLGNFTLDIETKPDGGTGYYQFQMTVPQLLGPDQRFSHSFQVEEYRAPEFKVEVVREEAKPLIFGDTLRAEVRGEYMHGAPLVGGQVDWVLRRSPASFQPPGPEAEGFAFGAGGYGYSSFGGFRGRHRLGHRGFGPAPGITRVLGQGKGSLDGSGLLAIEHLTQLVEPDKDGTKPTDATKRPEKPLPLPATYTIDSTVTDENRQAIAGSASFVVHPAKLYVGVRTKRAVVRVGEKAAVESIAVDLEGHRVPGAAVEVEVIRKQTERKAEEVDGRWTFRYETTEHKAGGCALTSTAAPSTCEVAVTAGGQHVVRAKAKDTDGHETVTESQFFVYGKDAVVWGDESSHRVDLVPDKREYAPGEKATILVRSPFPKARGLVVVEREGIAKEIPITVEGGATTVQIDVAETMVPGITLSAMVVQPRVDVPGAPPGQDLGMPAAAAGQIDLDVSSASKKIEVELKPHATEVAPKDTLRLEVATTDGNGKPTKSALAIMVVDEAVLSLVGYQTPDPLAFFHHRRPGQVWLHASHRDVLPRDTREADRTVTATTRGPKTAADKLDAGGVEADDVSARFAANAAQAPAEVARPEGKSSGKFKKQLERSLAPAKPAASPAVPRRSRNRALGEAGLIDPRQAMAQPVSLRTLFSTTAFFDAEVTTDDNGQATVEIPMPENLTSFRIMAVAIDPEQADRFGSADATVKVRKPIMVRPSMPRFANLGDSFEGSVMVDNQTKDAQSILVGTRGLNVKFSGQTESVVQIPAGESREVRFPMEVQKVGKMRLQFAAMSNAGRDATELTVPVNLPATRQAFADYGMTDSSIARVIEPPADALPGYGGLEVSMSSTALNGLEDAVEYLVDYPYECAEQTASRVLPIFALGKILDEFPIASVKDQALRDQLATDGIKRMLAKQGYDGGFGYWHSRESWPYVTNWVTLALLEGKRAGLKIDEPALRRAMNYLDNYVRRGVKTRWGDYYDWTSRSFALWLLSREGRGGDQFDKVWRHRKDVPLYGRILLMSAAHRYGRTNARDEVVEELRQATVESARTIHFAESKSEAAAQGLRLLMHSSVQTDAVALLALLETAPTDPMLPKIMAGIMSGRDPKRGGRWGTTHANAWALMAAGRYYETVEKDEPDYLARIWLDGSFAGEQRFEGRDMAKTNQRVKMADLLGADKRELVLSKDGPGKLYYRFGLRYAPKDLKLAAEDQGFVVYRTYEALGTGDEKPDPEAVVQLDDGSWTVKAGTNVRVSLTLVASDRANYVVVDDPLPAGFEGQNPRFVTSVAAEATASRDRGSYEGWWWPWWRFDHTEMRDDRMLLFADRMPAGVYTYSYTARATTLGEFQLPPVHAEAMYEPERFGHSASSVVRVVK